MTVGGTTSGYSVIGSSGIAITPAAKIRMDKTAANIGRSTKKREKSFTTRLPTADYGPPATVWGAGSPMRMVWGSTGMPGKKIF